MRENKNTSFGVRGLPQTRQHNNIITHVWGRPHCSEKDVPAHENTDRAIDTLVYQLYSLTEAEIKIIEGKYYAFNWVSGKNY